MSETEFGLFFQLPRAAGQDTATRYHDTIEQIVLADQIGFDAAWLAEMHFIAEFSILPAPLIVAAAAAARTSRIRLGTGVALLPLHDPVRAAEDAATLDILSGGRLEYGIGRGSIARHFEGLGVPQSERAERFNEVVDILRLAWADAPFSYHGRYHDYDNVSVEPKPLQKPHPPLRLAANSDESIERAGREGWRVMVSPVTAFAPELKRRLDAYRGQRTAGGGAFPASDIGWLAPVYVAEDGDQAREEARESMMSYLQVVAKTSTDAISAHGGDLNDLPPLVRRFRDAPYDQILREMCAIGSPAEVRETLAGVQREYGAGHFLTWFNPGGLIPTTQVERSMRLFMEQVAPGLAREQPGR